MAFYTLNQLVAGLGSTTTDYAVQHKEVMDVMIYADATLTNPNNKKNVFDSLVLLDQQWETSLKNKGLPYLFGPRTGLQRHDQGVQRRRDGIGGTSKPD